MADANEDLLHTISGAPQHADDADSDDEADDMAPNFLNFTSTTTPSAPLSQTSIQPSGSLPKRGVKDFEANPTLLQSRTLAASRQAMHDALSHTRVHHPHGTSSRGSTVVGTYDAETGETFVRRAHARGKMFVTVGAAKRVCLDGGIVREWFSLLPEEALWALESGRLDVRYPTVDGENEVQDVHPRDSREHEKRLDSDAENEDEAGKEVEEEEEEEEALGMPMSLQGAYAAFIGEEAWRGGNLTAERYLVYAGLKRAGYTVLRAEGWNGKPTYPPEKGQDQLANAISNAKPSSLWSWLYSLIFRQNDDQESSTRQQLGPLVPPGLYRNYNDIYRRLHLIPSFATPNPTSNEPSDLGPFTTTFNVYKPSASYRKSAPGPPDFRICVVSARDQPLPTLTQLSSLIEEQPLQRPRPRSKAQQDKAKAKEKSQATNDTKSQQSTQAQPPASSSTSSVTKKEQPSQDPDPHFTPNAGNIGHMYSRLKRGWKNVIIAVVDEGLVSYLRFSDSCFCREKLYERHVGVQRGSTGGKGGGGRGGKGGGGRGRNRGKGGR